MESGQDEELDGLGIREVLDADPRPTFVIDLDPDEESPVDARAILPIFSNVALRTHERLFDGILGNEELPPTDGSQAGAYEKFRAWATGVTPHDDTRDVFPQTFLYGDVLWTGSTVRQRWRLISGNRSWRPQRPLLDLSSGAPIEVATGGTRAEQAAKLRDPDEPPRKSAGTQVEGSSLSGSITLASTKQKSHSFFSRAQKAADANSSSTGSSQSASILLSAPDKAVADWTVVKPKGVLSAHVEFARSVKWSNTPLGPMEKWSPEFRQLANLCMNNPHPAALFWGSELTMLYNEAYADEVAGNKHPSLMGTGFSGPFAELWDYAGPVFAECARTGISVRKENDYLPIDRRNLLEETFFSWSFTPLYGGTDRTLGFYNAPFETTQQVLHERRMETLSQISDRTAPAKTVKQFWYHVLEGLRGNEFDVPFALLYSVGDAEDGDHSSMSSGSTMSLKSCHLEGSIGVPDGHIAAPRQLDLKRSREGFVPSFREAMRTREPTLLHTRDGTLPEALLDGINWRGFGEPCREAIIFPVRPTNSDAVLAFLVLGVSPRRLFDNEYKAWSSMLNRQLATSLASVILFEEEVRRSRDAVEAAALEKEHLTQQLDLQASRLRRMTELSPLGMFLISPDGVLREANDRFFEMTGHPRDTQYEMSWTDCILESSAGTMADGWRRLIEDHIPWSGELQLKKPRLNDPVALDSETIEHWVLFSAHSEFSSDGSLRSIMGSITDVSHLKWAQGLQNRRLQEAEETRRQQNEFIDITSHEMRNPLSAILQCADDILSALSAGTASPEVIESCVDAAHTISLCVQHQKSIVDDILTISKLDSNLLLITPVPAQPREILSRAVKMFDLELQAKSIEVVIDVHPSYKELDVDWVAIDPSRVLQILINLMTNAIKFTAPADRRLITVEIAASNSPPESHIPGFQYVPANATNTITSGFENWGSGEIMYVRFMVQDTGCGLTQDEKQILFQRFKQASPRTHAQYGGSGLGLFISKRLAELHGGQIGVASEEGQGSVFGFFLEAKRSSPRRDSLRPGALPLEHDLVGHSSISPQLTPHRQDYSVAGLSASASFDPRTLAILVVEDNLINQRVLVKQLKKVGCTVSVANDGLEALEFLEATHFRRQDGLGLSIILMDLEMPNMDGLTCVREIRRMEALGEISQRVPVIAVTANVRDEQVAEARASGMDDVVSKPFRIPDLLSKVETVLRAMSG